MKKRFLSLLLAVMMVVSLVPAMGIGVSAEGNYTYADCGGLASNADITLESNYFIYRNDLTTWQEIGNIYIDSSTRNGTLWKYNSNNNNVAINYANNKWLLYTGGYSYEKAIKIASAGEYKVVHTCNVTESTATINGKEYAAKTSTIELYDSTGTTLLGSTSAACAVSPYCCRLKFYFNCGICDGFEQYYDGHLLGTFSAYKCDETNELCWRNTETNVNATVSSGSVSDLIGLNSINLHYTYADCGGLASNADITLESGLVSKVDLTTWQEIGNIYIDSSTRNGTLWDYNSNNNNVAINYANNKWLLYTGGSSGGTIKIASAGEYKVVHTCNITESTATINGKEYAAKTSTIELYDSTGTTLLGSTSAACTVSPYGCSFKFYFNCGICDGFEQYYDGQLLGTFSAYKCDETNELCWRNTETNANATVSSGSVSDLFGLSSTILEGVSVNGGATITENGVLVSINDYTSVEIEGPVGAAVRFNSQDVGSIDSNGSVIINFSDYIAKVSDIILNRVTVNNSNSFVSFYLDYTPLVDTIPTIEINLDDDKTLSYLTSSRKNVASGTLTKIDTDGTENTYTLSSIHGRGNTSWGFQLKPFAIKLSKKAKLVATGEKAKKFNLLNIMDSIYDLRLGDAFARELLTALGENTTDYEFVKLFVNDEYVGVYLLTEKVNTVADVEKSVYETEDETYTVRVEQANGIKGGLNNATGNSDDIAVLEANVATNYPPATSVERLADDSTDIAIAAGIQAYQYSQSSEINPGNFNADYEEELYGGYLIESTQLYGGFMTNGSSDVHSYFITRRGRAYEICEPENATKEQVQQIAVYVQGLEDALYSDNGYNSLGKHYSDYLDLDNMAKEYVVKAFCNDNDYAEVSTFYYVSADKKTGIPNAKLTSIDWDFHTHSIDSQKLFSSTQTSNNIKWILLTKGDFVAKVQTYSIQMQSAVSTALNTTLPALYSTIELQVAKDYRDKIIQYYSPNTMYNKLITSITKRYNYWYNTIWSDTTNALRGVTASNNNGTLTANAVGATSYQWYKLDADGYTGTEVTDATSSTYTPTDAGTYYVVATGTALAGTTATSMTSNPIETTANFRDGASISLKDNTWLNFYTDLTDDNYADYHFTYTVNGGEEIAVESSMVLKVSGKWRVSIALLPYQLADEITVTMYNSSNVVVSSKTDSVQDYAGRCLTNSTDENYKAAVRALLDYGAAVQTWQGYNTTNLANSILNP